MQISPKQRETCFPSEILHYISFIAPFAMLKKTFNSRMCACGWQSFRSGIFSFFNEELGTDICSKIIYEMRKHSLAMHSRKNLRHVPKFRIVFRLYIC